MAQAEPDVATSVTTAELRMPPNPVPLWRPSGMVSCRALPVDAICPQSCWSAIPGSGVAPPRVTAVAPPWVTSVAAPHVMAVAMEGCGGQGGGLL